ncbi:Holliday junction ATP-dependent DNA helicase RuvA [compost metagenome]
MLSSITPVEIQTAIVNADLPLIQRIKGIGAKTAQRLVLELQDKLKKEGSGSLISAPLNNTVREEALSALMMLGFVKLASEKAIDKAVKDGGQDLSVEQMIKIALKNL